MIRHVVKNKPLRIGANVLIQIVALLFFGFIAIFTGANGLHCSKHACPDIVGPSDFFYTFLSLDALILIFLVPHFIRKYL